MARKKQASKKKVVEKKVEEEEEVNYAATADAFFEKMSDEEESEDEYDHRADYDEEDEDANDDEHVSSDEHEDDSIQEEENSDSIEDRDNEEDDDQQESDEEDDAPEEKVAIKPPVSAMGESCTFDLRNLLAMNTHQIDATSLYTKKKKQSSEEKVTIPATEALDVVVNEKYLLEKATDGCTQLISAIWQLPVERSDAGPKVTLPSFDESRIPRALVSLITVLTNVAWRLASCPSHTLFSCINSHHRLQNKRPSGRSLQRLVVSL